MNRLYVIKVGSLEIKGLISPSELPDLMAFFETEAKRRSASARYAGNGLLIAVKDGIEISLTVGTIEASIPSRCVFDEIDKAMDHAFGRRSENNYLSK